MTNDKKEEDKSQFLDAASHNKERGLVGEFVGFMRENKAWWMAPILIVLALVGVLLIVFNDRATTEIYTLF